MDNTFPVNITECISEQQNKQIVRGLRVLYTSPGMYFM